LRGIVKHCSGRASEVLGQNPQTKTRRYHAVIMRAPVTQPVVSREEIKTLNDLQKQKDCLPTRRPPRSVSSSIRSPPPKLAKNDVNDRLDR